MPAAWSKKDERQYKRILKSCSSRGRGQRTCKRIAAATVNKQRRAEGRTLGELTEAEKWGMLLIPIAGLGVMLALSAGKSGD